MPKGDWGDPPSPTDFPDDWSKKPANGVEAVTKDIAALSTKQQPATVCLVVPNLDLDTAACKGGRGIARHLPGLLICISHRTLRIHLLVEIPASRRPLSK